MLILLAVTVSLATAYFTYERGRWAKRTAWAGGLGMARVGEASVVVPGTRYAMTIRAQAFEANTPRPHRVYAGRNTVYVEVLLSQPVRWAWYDRDQLPHDLTTEANNAIAALVERGYRVGMVREKPVQDRSEPALVVSVPGDVYSFINDWASVQNAVLSTATALEQAYRREPITTPRPSWKREAALRMRRFLTTSVGSMAAAMFIVVIPGVIGMQYLTSTVPLTPHSGWTQRETVGERNGEYSIVNKSADPTRGYDPYTDRYETGPAESLCEYVVQYEVNNRPYATTELQRTSSFNDPCPYDSGSETTVYYPKNQPELGAVADVTYMKRVTSRTELHPVLGFSAVGLVALVLGAALNLWARRTRQRQT